VKGAMKQGWISATFLAILLALGIGFVFILPRVRAIRGALPEGNGGLPANAVALLQAPTIPTLIRVRGLLAFGIVYLMTVKPESLVASLLVLRLTIGLGLLASAGTFSKRKAA